MEKILGFLSVLLGLLAIWEAKRTDILVRSEDERAKNLIKETQRMIDEGNKRAQEIIREMDERHTKLLQEIHETQRYIQETQRDIQETQRYIATLIKAEGEEAKELINKFLEKIPEKT
ncbi:MAG: hypothetical protein ACP5OB_03270, partial [Candidatus Ratteibacteria bacterium]